VTVEINVSKEVPAQEGKKMAMIGLDVEAVEQLSANLKSQGGAIDGVINAIDGLVNQIPSIWKGADAEQFITWWTGQHKPALIQVRDHVNGLGDSAHNNAQAQVDVSSH
jgi:WXG100 family type VII secretion target